VRVQKDIGDSDQIEENMISYHNYVMLMILKILSYFILHQKRELEKRSLLLVSWASAALAGYSSMLWAL
jgi:hypothetical protein